MAPKAAKVRPSHDEPPTGAASVIDFSESGEFDCAQLAATLCVFFAALTLILDVCLGHAHQLIAGTPRHKPAAGRLLSRPFGGDSSGDGNLGLGREPPPILPYGGRRGDHELRASPTPHPC